MLELKGITKVYRTKSGCVRALDGVSLTLPPTGLVFITGKSGCGKTTLLNLIGGLDGADEGEISLLGKSFFSFTQSDYDDYRNTFIGFIFQEYNLLNEFSVRKNIELAMEIQGGAADEGALDALMREMEIDGLQSRKPSELSGGQRQRVAIARALVKNPRIIMADEPTGALDEGTGIQVLDLLKKLSKDKLVIVVSHDREFAERYADRIIRLVDGRIAEDITFTEYTTRGNITEEGDTLLVSEGADLDEGEKNALAKAIKQRKKIEIIKKLSFREAKTTVQSEIARSAESSPELKSSRMKLKSAVSMGVKSLWVKPLRLVLTVLLSALAFAVFGLFDTLAGFTTESVVSNMMRESRTVALHGEFISDYQADDKYAVKLSSSSLSAFASESGCSVKGVYSLADNLDGGAVSPDSLIKELNSSSISVGKLYYTKTVNGYIEFSPDEISDSGVIKPFGYRLVAGAYPKLSENNEIAISTFVAQSVLHYYGEESCELLGLTSIDKLVGTTLTVNNTEYIISGLIDCGEIPQKYDTLKSQTYAVKSLSTLISDYKAFIGSGGHKCIFVPEGFLKAHKDREANATVYYGGTAKWSVQSGNLTRSATPYFYTVNDYTKNRLLLFNDAQPTVMQPQLKDDEVLVHPSNLEALFNAEIAELSPEQKDEVKLLVAQIEKAPEQNERKAAFEEFTALVSNGAKVSEKAVTVVKASAVTGSTEAKTVKVVGAYIGVDKTRSIPSGYYRLMMNNALMNELGIYTEQGDYDRFLISPRDSARGSKQLLNYMLNESGLSLVWYDNSALETIRYNEELIKDTADLFLIAALVLALFSVFMLFNYIATSISNKKQSIGVLRGLGSRGKDILVTFLSESLIISLVSGLLANAIAAVGCLLVNLYIESVMSISVPFAIYSIRQFFIITGLSVITGLISSALPIARISKTKPVELIRRV